MKDNFPALKVYMLGGFSMVYGEKPISFRRNSLTKTLLLLQMLVFAGKNGIAREKLLESLYGREEMTDAANNLRVTVFRLKKALVQAGLPTHEYIEVKNGIYYWNAPMRMELDVVRFCCLLERAGQETSEETKIQYLKMACQMYKGEFLPMSSGEEWVLLSSIKFKKMYSDAMNEVCGYLKEKKEYEKALKWSTAAAEIYPFDDWQAIKMECYIAMNRYKEAYKEYEDTANMLLEELGINPSERMQKLAENMSDRIGYAVRNISEIKKEMRESGERDEGAFYCTLPGFRDNYRLVRRMMEREGQSVYLMVCSITDGKGYPMEDREKTKQMSRELCKAIKCVLRREDSFTKYSSTQYLILLVGTDQENCELIFERIKQYFTRDHKSWGRYLEKNISCVLEKKI